MEMNGSARSRIGRIACLFAFAALLWPGRGMGDQPCGACCRQRWL